MVTLAVATDRYVGMLDRLATQTSGALLRHWDAQRAWGLAEQLAWSSTARPYLAAAADAALGVADAYASIVAPGRTTAPSDLISPDAAARAYDPWDRLTASLAAGRPFLVALDGARSQVDAVARDSVLRSARQGLPEMVEGEGAWMRRVTGESCDWCVEKSGIVWPTKAQATFGHPQCDCTVVPASAARDHNRPIREARGISESGYGPKQQTRSLERSKRTAGKHEAEARRQLRTETDPARRRRLEERAADWSVRRQRLDQRIAAIHAA